MIKNSKAKIIFRIIKKVFYLINIQSHITTKIWVVGLLSTLNITGLSDGRAAYSTVLQFIRI